MVGLARPLPASAQATSFRQELNDIKNTIPGLGEEHAPIDFTERAPLVVPPTNDLPPPADAPRLGLNDPDTLERTKALSDPRRPVPPTDPGASAAGANARNFLIDPPSGMQNPDAIANQAAADGFKDAPKHKKTSHSGLATHHTRHTPAVAAQ